MKYPENKSLPYWGHRNVVRLHKEGTLNVENIKSGKVMVSKKTLEYLKGKGEHV